MGRDIGIVKMKALRVNLLMTKKAVLEFLRTKKGFIVVNISKIKNKVKEKFNFQMVVITKEIGMKINITDMVIFIMPKQINIKKELLFKEFSNPKFKKNLMKI